MLVLFFAQKGEKMKQKNRIVPIWGTERRKKKFPFRNFLFSKPVKGSLALLLTASLLFGLFGITTLATDDVGNEVTLYYMTFPRSEDSSYPSSTTTWGHPTTLTFMDGSVKTSSDHWSIHLLGGYTGEVCYCIEPGVSAYQGTSHTAKDEDYFNDLSNATLNKNQIQLLLGRLMQYGFTGNRATSWLSQNTTGSTELATCIATQILVWEVIVGERDINFNHVSAPGGYDEVLDLIQTGHPLYSKIISAYKSIVSNMQNHSLIPSFLAEDDSEVVTYDMTYNESSGLYELTLTDTNNVLHSCSFSVTNTGTDKVSYSISGNTFTLTASGPDVGTVIISGTKTKSRYGILVWESSDSKYPNDQTTISIGQKIDDPITGTVQAQVASGTIQIAKTSEDNVIEGVTFEVYDNDGNLYTTVTTGSDGVATLATIPVGNYTIKEVTDSKYIELECVTVTVTTNSTAIAEFSNVLKKWSVTVTKLDAQTETNVSTGNATLQGAVYGLYKDGGLLTTYTTDENGSFTTEEYLCGTGYTLKEITAPYGYVLNETEYALVADAESYKAEHNRLSLTIYEEVAKGTITITKTGEVLTGFQILTFDATNNAETEVENLSFYQLLYDTQAIFGATYTISAAEDILNSDGSILVEKGTIVATLTTGATGSVTGEALYLGKYLIKEVTAPDGFTLDETAFAVELTYEKGSVSLLSESLTVSNLRQKALIRIYKELEENEDFSLGSKGEITEVAFALYTAEEITTCNGSVIPADSLLEIAFCDETGLCEFTADLPIGYRYYVKEYATEEHYLLDETVYAFSFYPEDDSTEEKVIEIGTTPIENKLKYGKIEGLKTGEDGLPLSGAVFGLFFTDETTFTTDTAILLATSDEKGIFLFENIPYGTWLIKEISAPDGYLLSEEGYFITVSEDGEAIGIVIPNDPSPQTGDTLPWYLWVLLGCGVYGAGMLLFFREKKKLEEK